MKARNKVPIFYRERFGVNIQGPALFFVLALEEGIVNEDVSGGKNYFAAYILKSIVPAS